jgi:hypothetical protein
MRTDRLKLLILGGFFIFAVAGFLLPETRPVSANDEETNGTLLKRLATYKSWKPLTRRDAEPSVVFKIENSSALG